MKFPSHRSLVGLFTAAALVLPIAATTAQAQNKPDPKKGLEAFKKEGCAGCHKSKDFPEAGALGPDLSKIATMKKAPEISAYIKKPKAGSIMPAFKGPNEVVEHMTAYLMTQK